MSEYVVKSKLEDKEWQIANQVRDHVFVCDDVKHDAGPTQLSIYVVVLIHVL